MRIVAPLLLFAIAVVPAHAGEPAAAASAASAVETRIELFDRVLAFRLPSGFVRATDTDNGTNVLIEFVPKGQTVANWTQLVTVQAYRGLGRSPEPTAQIARRAFYPAACKIGPLYADGGEKPFAPGVKRSIVSNGCASLPAGAYPKALKGAGEQDFLYIFRDADTIYTLNYAERGASFAGKAAQRGAGTAGEILAETFGTVSLAPKR